MSADDTDPPKDPRAARPALERRRGERRVRTLARAGRSSSGPDGVERRGADRRRGAGRETSASASESAPDLDAAERADAERRRARLRSMLELADARQARAAARRRDRPVMAPGVRVGVLVGPFVGESATIVDADYISNRVLVRLDDVEESLWLGFAEVGAAREGGGRGDRGGVRGGGSVAR